MAASNSMTLRASLGSLRMPGSFLSCQAKAEARGLAARKRKNWRRAIMVDYSIAGVGEKKQHRQECRCYMALCALIHLAVFVDEILSQFVLVCRSTHELR